MNDDSRRQMRDALMAKAKQMQEADRKHRLEAIKLFIKSRRAIKGPYSPEKCTAQLRDLFGDKHRKAIFGE